MAQNKRSRKQQKKSKSKPKFAWFTDRRMFVIYSLILLIVLVKVYPYVYDAKLSVAGDNTAYYILGKALAKGEGYTSIQSPGNNPANHFPPGYPFIIGTTMTILDYNFDTIKTTNGVFLYISMILLMLILFLLIRNIHLSILFTFLISLNFHLLNYSFIIMSEISFMMFSLAALVTLLITDYNKSPLKNISFILAILFSAMAFHIRTMGISLIVALLVYYIIHKNWRYLFAYGVGVFILLLPWQIRSFTLGGSSYVKQLTMKNPYRPELGQMEFGDWFTRIFENFIRYINREIPVAYYWKTFNYAKTPVETTD